MSDLTLQQIYERKYELEKTMTTMLKDFEKMSGCTIEDLEITRFSAIDIKNTMAIGRITLDLRI